MNTKTKDTEMTLEMTEPANHQVAIHQPAQLMAAPTPATLLQMAVQQGADLDRLERLMELQARWEAGEAKKAFTAAMAEFKASPPDIFKDKLVGYENRDGTFTGYKHTTLGGVCEKIIAALANVGISHKWDLQQDGGLITVTCVLTHRLGHSESTKMQAGADNSGKKNSIQAIGSTITYLQRYTLKAALGLAASHDDDGRNADAGKTITEDQADALRDLIEEVQADTAKFCKRWNIESLPDLPARQYDDAVKSLRAFGRQEQGGDRG